MTVVFDRMIEGCCFILYWFFPSSTPRDVHFFWFDTTALQVRTDLEDTRVSNESPPWSNNTRFYFFQPWNVLKGFWFQKEAYVYIYTYIHMNIYIGSREMIFEIFSLRSCCLMKWRLFQMVSFQIEAYQSAVGSFCWIFLLHRFLWQKRRVQVGNPAFLTSSIDMSELGWSEGCMK